MNDDLRLAFAQLLHQEPTREEVMAKARSRHLARALGQPTRKTLMYRNIARAQENPERNPALKRFLDREHAEYHTPERWATRRAVSVIKPQVVSGDA